MISEKRVVLRGSAGGGKSVALRKLASLAMGKGVVPILLNLKNWSNENSERIVGLGPGKVYEKLDVLLRASITDVTLKTLKSIPDGVRKLIVVDGLNEVYGEDPVREILNVLDDYVRLNTPVASVIVSDRSASRAFPGSRWVAFADLSPLRQEDMRKRVVAKFGKKAFDLLGTNDKKLLQVPYFLSFVLSRSSIRLGSRAQAVRSFFIDRLHFDAHTLNVIGEAGFAAYKDAKSTTFDAITFRKKVGDPTWRSLLDAGVLSKPVGGKTQFDHQLKQDFLASVYLSQMPQLWNSESFDAVSLDSNSFDALTMTLEQLADSREGDKFLKLVHDWNWFAAVTCMRDIRSKQPKFSSDLETAIIALIAEKLFDPMGHTRRRAKRTLNAFPTSTVAPKFGTRKTLKQLLIAVKRVRPREQWFARWKKSFTRSAAAPLQEDEVKDITSEDPIIGWTVSNVVKRSRLRPDDLRQLRAYYDSFQNDRSKNSCRWRIVHALGSSASQENVALLLRALDKDTYHWVKYGAARSLVEIAARTKEAAIRTSIRKELMKRFSLVTPSVLEEVGHATFYRRPVSPSSWPGFVLPLFRKATALQKDVLGKEKWKSLARDSRKYLKELR